MTVENYIFGKVLDNIAREEGEDRPNISQLLAWAKGDIIVCWVDSYIIIDYLYSKKLQVHHVLKYSY